MRPSPRSSKPSIHARAELLERLTASAALRHLLAIAIVVLLLAALPEALGGQDRSSTATVPLDGGNGRELDPVTGADVGAPDAAGGGGVTETGGSSAEGGGRGATPGQQTGGGGGGGGGSGGRGCTEFPGCDSAVGITDSTIRLGFIYETGGDELARSFGQEGRFGDGRAQAQALVDELNSRGGIAGRKIVPFFAAAQIETTPDPAAAQAICTDLTEDKHVFAAISFFSTADFSACFAAHHTFLLAGGGAGPAPWFVGPSVKSAARLYHTMVPVLAAGGFFTKDAKAALLTQDDAEHRAASDSYVKPLLARYGVPVVDEYKTVPLSVSDAQRDFPQAVLRFKQKGATHVFFLGLGQALLFMTNAESQNYRPRYALHSFQFPQQLERSAPRAQLPGAMGIGHRPQFDVAEARYPLNDQEKRCIAVMQRGGQTDVRSRSSGGTSFGYCENLWVFEAAAAAAGRELTAGRWAAALRSLGTSHPPVGTFRFDFSRGTPDAAFAHRRFAFDGACGCFQYNTPVTDDVPPPAASSFVGPGGRLLPLPLPLPG